MIVKFSNPIGTRISVDHEDGITEDVPTTDGNLTWIGILGQVAAGTLTIEPFASTPQEAKRTTKKATNVRRNKAQ
jgi:hypothetical protein